jgi:nucleotide-binding universal stress UspA family protein
MKILCATDLLPKSDSALERAGMLAESLEAQLVLMHVLPEAEPHHPLEEERQRVGRELRLRTTPPRWRHRVAPSFEIRSGDPVQALVAAARDLEPAVIVFGSSRRRFVCDALAGTVAERVLEQVDYPVLVVRRMPWRAYRRVLLLLDRTGSNEMIDVAARLVLHRPANAAVTRAGGPTPAELERAPITREPRGRSPAGPTPELQVAMLHERATMANLMRRDEGRSNPDLLVFGAGRCGWVQRMFLRDPVRRLVAARGCDSLTVPQRRECTAPRKPGRLGRRRWWKLPRACRPGARSPDASVSP